MSKRLFVSVDLPDRLAEPFETLQDRFADADGLRFTDPEQAHLTLKFLGDTDPARVDELSAALDRAVESIDVAPFEVAVGGLGVFPSTEYISVLWTGVDAGTAELTELHEAVERETTALGFDPADHEFTPHVTLARMDDARGKELVQRVVRESDPTVGSFTATEIRLTESELTDDGPEYSTVAAFELDG
ncbi:MAG: RNA 2',3'-cyclic phosphodiesterase [Halobaculum sp.]